jgi:dTDP-glucose 4,6-dehydratase
VLGKQATISALGLAAIHWRAKFALITSLVEKLLHEEKLDTIVHFAAELHIGRSITGLDASIETNVIVTHSSIKAAHTYWLDEKTVANHGFHHVSTDDVYRALGPNDPAFTEATPYAPNSPFARGKSASSLITYVQDRARHDRRYAINCSKIENSLGYRA